MSDYKEITQKQIEEIQQRLALQEKTTQVLLKSNQQLISWIDDILKENQHYKENCIFECTDPRGINENVEYWFPNVASISKTLKGRNQLHDLEMENLQQYMEEFDTNFKQNRMLN